MRESVKMLPPALSPLDCVEETPAPQGRLSDSQIKPHSQKVWALLELAPVH